MTVCNGPNQNDFLLFLLLQEFVLIVSSCDNERQFPFGDFYDFNFES